MTTQPAHSENEMPLLDEFGNPLVRAGCPNCGRGKRWMGVIEYAAACNSGRDPAGPCSRRCELQVEYAKELSACPEGDPLRAALREIEERAEKYKHRTEHLHAIALIARAALEADHG